MNLPQLIDGLQRPASGQDIDRAVAKIGRPLPPELRELYLLHDGETEKGVGLFFGLPFIPLQRLIDERQVWDDVEADVGSDPMMSEFLTSTPETSIKLAYANRGWLPISIDWSGNHIGIDTDPGSSGKYGQIINFGRDEDNMFVIAPSLAAFLGWVADSLEEGNYRIQFGSEFAPCGVDFALREPENEHFLDTVSKLYPR